MGKKIRASQDEEASENSQGQSPVNMSARLASQDPMKKDPAMLNLTEAQTCKGKLQTQIVDMKRLINQVILSRLSQTNMKTQESTQ